MNSLNYDAFSGILDYLSSKECLNVSISSKEIYNLVKNQGFLKTVYINKNYPYNRFENAIDISQRIMMHKRRVETIYINIIDNPCNWMFFWPKTVYFSGCYFDKGLINPRHKVQTENIYIRCKYDCKDIKINTSKFPNLKKLVIE